MIRRIAFFTILGLILAVLTYGYFYLKEIKTPRHGALEGVPLDAAMIIETTAPLKVWKKLSATNLMWEELMVTETFQTLDKRLYFLDSLFASDPKLHQLIAEPIAISFHKGGLGSFGILFVACIPVGMDEASACAVITAHAGDKNITRKNYEGTTLITIGSGQAGWTVTASEGLLFVSASRSLVEDALRHLATGRKLTRDEGFKKVMTTAGQNIDASTYINLHKLPDLLAVFLNKQGAESVENLQHYASWCETDLIIKPNALMLNGYASASDSSSDWLSLFREQNPVSGEALSVLPAGIGSFIDLGFSSFGKFLVGYKDALVAHQNQYKREKQIDEINKTYGVDVESALLSWFGDEVVVAEAGSAEDGTTPVDYMVVATMDPEEAEQELMRLTQAVYEQNKVIPDTSHYRRIQLHHLPLDNVYGKLLGFPFDRIKTPHFFIKDNYVVFANNNSDLRFAINALYANQTLVDNSEYAAFANEHLGDESNILIYCNLGRSSGLIKPLLKDSFAPATKEQSMLFNKFEAIAVQITNEGNGMFYNNVILKYNPVFKQVTTSLWEARLDTDAVRPPVMVMNHYTGAWESFVQDKGHKVYLISNTGKILWTKDLDGPILGDVLQIDIYKNGKLQLLCNTANHVYLIDRLGRDVSPFPLALESPAATSLSLFDYERNKNYRIAVPLRTGQILMYGADGKKVKGWTEPVTRSMLLQPMQYVSVAGKDYLIAVDDQTNVYAYNRRGEERIKFANQLSGMGSNHFVIQKGNDLAKTTIITTDTSGKVILLSLSDILSRKGLGQFSKKHRFYFGDVDDDGSGDFIITDGTALRVFDQDGAPITVVDFDSTITAFSGIYNFGGTHVMLGVVTSGTQQVFLLDKDGNNYPGTPLPGTSLFRIKDTNNDGVFEIICMQNRNSISAYTLNNP